VGAITQDIVFGVTGQSLFYDAPEGRPISIMTVQVWANAAGEIGTPEAATGALSIEAAPDTTVDELSGDGQADVRRLALTDVSAVKVGRNYRVQNLAREVEWVEVGGVSDIAGVVWSRHDLANAYEPGSLFQSTRLLAALDPTWLADQSHVSWELDVNPRWRVRWLYVSPVGQPATVVDTYFDVLHYAARYSVTGLDVEDMEPGWLDRLPRDDRDTQGSATIKAAYDSVKWDLYGDLVPDQSIRNRELFERLIAARAAFAIVPTEASQLRYSKLYEQLIRSGVAPIDTPGGTVPVEKRPVWRR
jgi:hypothetical protein